jgi:hypothetical protein
MKTQAEIRRAFWESINASPQSKPAGRSPSGRLRYRPKTQNEYPCDTRQAFCDFVEYLSRDNQIPASLAQRVTL